MSNSTETFTDKIKRQQEEQAQELLNHARQTLLPLKTDITRLYGDVGHSIKENTASILSLLKKNLIFRWWFYPLTATIFLAALILPGVWAGGKMIVEYVEKDLNETIEALADNEQALKEMRPWGVRTRVIDWTRYLEVPGKRKPELVPSDSGEVWFVKVGPEPKPAPEQ